MTNKSTKLDISRRKLLAGLGTIGVASAGAGLGTTAVLNDLEAFTGNSLTAGTLDLKLDYKSTYFGGPGRLEDVQAMGYPNAEDLGDGLYLLDQAPSPAELQSWEDFVTGEQFPFCSPEADEFLVNGDEIPVFTLEDVKPGDGGEVTISVHICDNPAYLWMSGELYDDLENGQTEPESQVDQSTDMGELGDSILARAWYDEDCDNVFEPTGTGEQQELEVALVSDVSGSMADEIGDLKTAAKNFVDNLANPDEAAAVSFSNGASLDQELTTNYQAVKDAIDLYTAGGGTDMGAGISTAETELLSGTNATAGASKVMIVLTDGQPTSQSAAISAATSAKGNGIRIFTIALGAGAATSFLENNIASSPDDAYVAPDPADLDTVYSEIAQVVLAGEQLIVEGTLNEVFEVLADGGVLLDGDRQEEGIQCYPGATTQCIGFEWELPIDVGNEVQTDSVAFDIGFYAEQCRHNTLIETSVGEGWAKQEEFDQGIESSFARARYGNNLADAGDWELGLGTPGPSLVDQAGYVWTSGATVPFSYEYDGVGNATFTLDGQSVSGPVPDPNGLLAVQVKADEATIAVENLELTLDGSSTILYGPNGVEASNDGADRALGYLVLDTSAAQVDEPFALAGDVTVTLQGDYSGNDEDVAFDIVVE